jgi:uncharacterized membrane protein
MAGGSPRSPSPEGVGKGRFEAFSDGVFAIAITLLVLELSIGSSGSAFDRGIEAWPFFLAYLVSFLTIGAAWLAHTAMSSRLRNVDAILLRINLLLLLFVSLLPFPTRLVVEETGDVSGERIFVVMYGLTLMTIRLLLFALDEYAHKEELYEELDDEKDTVRKTILPVLLAYIASILLGLIVPTIAVALYCLLAIILVIPFKELVRVLFRSR